MLSIAANAAWELREGAAVDLDSEPFVYRITPALVADEPCAFVVDGQVMARMRKSDHLAFAEAARIRPMEVPVTRTPNVEPPPHAFWQYRDRVYFTDERPESAVGLLARMERLEDDLARRTFAALPQRSARPVGAGLDVKHAVWERDRGCCQSCGATYDLQFERIVTASDDRAPAVEDLQLRCDACIARGRLAGPPRAARGAEPV